MRLLRSLTFILATFITGGVHAQSMPEPAALQQALKAIEAESHTGFAGIRGARIGDPGSGRYTSGSHLAAGDAPLIVQPEGSVDVFYVNTLRKGLTEAEAAGAFKAWQSAIAAALPDHKTSASSEEGDAHFQDFASPAGHVRLSREQRAEGWAVVISVWQEG